VNCYVPTAIERADHLLALTRQPDYVARVLEVVLTIPLAVDTADAVGALSDAIRCMGADVAAWCTFIQEAPDRAAYRFFVACDPRWCVEYEHCGGYLHDPWLAYARAHPEPIVASHIRVSGDRQSEVVQLAERFGFRSAVVVPVPAGAGITRVGMLCAGSRTPGFFESAGYEAFKVVARSLAWELQEWWLRTLRAGLIRNWRLNELDLLLLARERAGVGSKEIARELRSTPTAVDCRFARIIARIGVADRKAAAQIAAEYGVI
jgi:hypothetical protein